MKSFRKTLIRRLKISAAAAAFGILAAGACIIYSLTAASAPDTSLLARGIGIFIGIEAVCFSRIFRYTRALKSPETLETLEISEKDERNQSIQLKACRCTLLLTLTLLGFGTLIASFFSPTLFFTLAAVLIIMLMIFLAFWGYFRKG